jgi:hypothetical protein
MFGLYYPSSGHFYNHLYDLDFECSRLMGSYMGLQCFFKNAVTPYGIPLRENIQYLCQISDRKNILKVANITETCSH